MDYRGQREAFLPLSHRSHRLGRYGRILLAILALYNSLLFVRSDAYSMSLMYYVVTYFTAPLAAIITSWIFMARRGILKSFLLALLTACALLAYRWVLFPFNPTLTAARPEVGGLSLCEANMESIEIVYTWVNVSDTKWQALSNSFGCDTSWFTSSGGDADPFNSLKYSMRSVFSNLAFASKILIVTERDQAPTWLDRTHPKVQVVFHDEFMPPESAPVFNSNPTELLLYNLKAKGFIKNDCFLYMNDDFFINKAVTIDDFLTEDGHIVFNSVSHLSLPGGGFVDVPFGTWDIEEPASAARITDPHVPYLIHGPALKKLLTDCGEECRPNLESRCSRAGPMPMDYLQDFLARKHAYLLDFVAPARSMTMRLPLGQTSLSPGFTRVLLRLLRPRFVYIESHDAVEDNHGYVDLIHQYLETNFPEKAPWEI